MWAALNTEGVSAAMVSGLIARDSCIDSATLPTLDMF